jgi:hypothetical protein
MASHLTPEIIEAIQDTRKVFGRYQGATKLSTLLKLIDLGLVDRLTYNREHEGFTLTQRGEVVRASLTR